MLFADPGSGWKAQQFGMVQAQGRVAQIGHRRAHALPAHGLGPGAKEASVDPFEEAEAAPARIEDTGDELRVVDGFRREPVLLLPRRFGQPDQVGERRQIALPDDSGNRRRVAHPAEEHRDEFALRVCHRPRRGGGEARAPRLRGADRAVRPAESPRLRADGWHSSRMSRSGPESTSRSTSCLPPGASSSRRLPGRLPLLVEDRQRLVGQGGEHGVQFPVGSGRSASGLPLVISATSLSATSLAEAVPRMRPLGLDRGVGAEGDDGADPVLFEQTDGMFDAHPCLARSGRQDDPRASIIGRTRLVEGGQSLLAGGGAGATLGRSSSVVAPQTL